MSLSNVMAVCLYRVVVFKTSSFLYQTCTVHVIFCVTLVTPYNMNHILWLSPLLKKLFCNEHNYLEFKKLSPFLKQSRMSELKNQTSNKSICDTFHRQLPTTASDTRTEYRQCRSVGGSNTCVGCPALTFILWCLYFLFHIPVILVNSF